MTDKPKNPDTHRILAASGSFKERCKAAGIAATKRQASKLRLKRGFLYRTEKGMDVPPLSPARTRQS